MSRLVQWTPSNSAGYSVFRFRRAKLYIDFFYNFSLLYSAPGQSPLELRELAPGRHRVRVDPVCKGLSRRVVTLFDVEEHL